MTILPQATFGRPPSVLRLRPGGCTQNLGRINHRPKHRRFYSFHPHRQLFATLPVFVRFGGTNLSVAASDHSIPEGLYYDITTGGDVDAHYKHVAAMRNATDGIVYISEN